MISLSELMKGVPGIGPHLAWKRMTEEDGDVGEEAKRRFINSQV